MSSLDNKLKKYIVTAFIKSGINISPEVLDLFSDFEDRRKQIDFIIKQVSFMPEFNSHLTPEVLKEIDSEEIQTALKSRTSHGELSSYRLNNDVFDTESNPLESSTNIDIGSVHPKETADNEPPITVRSPVNNIDSRPSFNSLEQETENAMIPPIKEANIEAYKISSCSKSAFAYKPIAKEYEFKFDILKDPTGKLYTNGEYDDFYDLTLDKFNSLRSMLRKRPDVTSATNIKNIYRISHKVDVSIIGMINDIRTTKNGNYLLTVEDLSGSVAVLVKKNNEDMSIVKLIERTIEDQMIYVEGMYNPGKSNRKGLIFAKNVLKIDLPLDHQHNRSKDPISLALISDTHMGSKEFEEKLWRRFLKALNGQLGNKALRERIGKVKYLIINGDLVDGIGVYPDQKSDLLISDIFKQYKYASELLSEIPEYIQIFYCSGNHEPVRNAIPRPAVPKKYCNELLDIGIKCVGNPSYIKTHEVTTLVFHGDSMLDMNMLIPGLENDKAVETMKEMLIARHMAPIYGKKTQLAPVKKDWLVIDKIPDIFHTGHLHINGYGQYKNVVLVNSGCFQSQTDFMRSMGIHPTPGLVPIIELDSFQYQELNLNNNPCLHN